MLCFILFIFFCLQPVMKHLISLIFLLSALPLSAQHADTLRAVDHSWLFGVGRTHVLDTYLSPQDYVGAGFSVSHRTERKARWGRGRVTVVAHYRADAAHLTGQSGDGREWDANLRVGVGWMWNKRSAQRPFRLAFGPLIEAGTGITYNTRNGNNPAQGRLFMDVAAAGLAEYAFRVGRQQWQARAEVAVPLAGLAFSPAYGQSYYELFGLGHRDHNCVISHVGNAPSLHFLATLSLPLGRSRLTLGYGADVRQSHFNHIKTHHWQNQFVIGYTRRLRLLK